MDGAQSKSLSRHLCITIIKPLLEPRLVDRQPPLQIKVKSLLVGRSFVRPDGGQRTNGWPSGRADG